MMNAPARCFVAILAWCWSLAALSAPPTSPGDGAFVRQFGDRFLDAWWRLNPDIAIGNGYYKYADLLIVPDARSRENLLRQVALWRSALERIEPASLSDHLRADRAILLNKFESTQWHLSEHRAWEWDPSEYNVAEPFALLLSTEYASLDTRLRTVLKRLERVSAYYEAAKRNIRNPTRQHTLLAIDQNRGTLEVFGQDLQKKVEGSGLTADERALFADRLAAARAAIENYISWLETLAEQLARSGARSFRIGGTRYEQQFALTIQSGDTAKALYRRALEEKERLLERMMFLTDTLWPRYFPDTAPPEDRFERIGKVIAHLSTQHVAVGQLFAEIQRQIPELERWVIEHDLLTLDPTKPLRVRETPLHKRGLAGASVDFPGPYDPTGPTYYNVTPFDGLTPERIESLLREYNRWILPVLTIHEAVPGHHVQMTYANRSPSRIKSVFPNGAMVEGWAVYAERMMLESGFGPDSTEFWLIYSKWNVRTLTNTILDYSVHVLDMSEDQAMTLLMREGFQTEAEARAKWKRVQLSSVQLTMYYAGHSAIHALRERLKREWGSRFSLKRFHEQFLSYGSAPITIIEELMTAEQPPGA